MVPLGETFGRPSGREGGMRDTAVRDDLGARAFDVFCPAAFLQVAPWTAALELLLAAGPADVATYDQTLVDQLVAGLDPARYALVSPAAGPRRSTLVVVRPNGPADGRAATAAEAATLHARLTAAGVDAALREDAVRLSPHLYNTPAEIARALDALDGALAPA